MDIPSEAPFLIDFEIERRAGTGAFGSVFYAVKKADGGYFAAKLIGPETKELEILKSLTEHECIVPFLNWYVPCRGRKETIFVFPAYDVDLQRLLHSRRSMPKEFPECQRNRICIDVFRGLAHLHGQGILHRDIKPANIHIRLSEPANAVIGDFGLAIRVQSAPSFAAGDAHTVHKWLCASRVVSGGFTSPGR